MKVIDNLTKIPRHVHLYVDYGVYIFTGIFRNLKEMLEFFLNVFSEFAEFSDKNL